MALDSVLRDLIAFRLGSELRGKVVREASLSFVGNFVVELVGKDADLYRIAVEAGVGNAELLLPLQGFRPGPDWVPFAEIATAAHLSAADIAREAILHGLWGGSPDEIRSWIEELGRIEAERPKLLELARAALDLARQRLEGAIVTQKQIEMRGLAAGG